MFEVMWSHGRRVPVHSCGTNFVPARSVPIGLVGDSMVFGDIPKRQLAVTQIGLSMDEDGPDECEIDYPDEDVEESEEEDDDEGELDNLSKDDILRAISETTKHTVGSWLQVEGAKLLAQYVAQIAVVNVKEEEEPKHTFCGDCEICGFKAEEENK